MGGNKVRYIDWDTKKDEKLVTKIYIPNNGCALGSTNLCKRIKGKWENIS